jgi:hypothetical protein
LTAYCQHEKNPKSTEEEDSDKPDTSAAVIETSVLKEMPLLTSIFTISKNLQNHQQAKEA